MVNQVREFLSIAGAAARIDVQHHEPLGRPDLLVGVEAVSVVGERSSVNLQNERILLCRIKIRRLDDPSFHLSLVDGRFEPEFLHRAQFLLHEQLLVHRGKHACLRVRSGSDGDIPGVGRRAIRHCECPILRHRE